MHSCFLSRLQPGNRQVGHRQQRLTGSMVRGRETVSAQRETRGDTGGETFPLRLGLGRALPEAKGSTIPLTEAKNRQKRENEVAWLWRKKMTPALALAPKLYRGPVSSPSQFPKQPVTVSVTATVALQRVTVTRYPVTATRYPATACWARTWQSNPGGWAGEIQQG